MNMTGSNSTPNNRKSRRAAENLGRLLEESEMGVSLAQEEGERADLPPSPGTGETSATSKPREHTELTVDLPQGQKLTVKGIEPGTIVEVASWSGKSGPHEGAIRMLFGASDQGEEESRGDESAGSHSDSATGTIEAIPAEGLTEETGVNQIMHPRRADLQRDRRGDYSLDQVNGGMWVKLMKRSFVALGTIGLLVGAVFGLRAAEILYFVHPQSGLTTGLGGAETSIAAVNPRADMAPNSTVVVDIDGSLVIVGVSQVGGNDLFVFNGSGQSVVSQDDVVGRVIFVIPFLGYLAGGD